MNELEGATAPEARRWGRVAVIVIRAVLLVFLVWALISARFRSETPIAEDAAATSRDSRSSSEPSIASPPDLG